VQEFAKPVAEVTARPMGPGHPPRVDDRRHGVVCMRRNKEEVMKIIVSTLIALSVLAGIAAPANALDAKTFWEHQDASRY
jgi:hypothetical protein